MKRILALMLAATAVTGLLAGASLDQSIKQLPARRRIGSAAYSQYSRAADLGSGVAFYSVLGIGSALLTIATAVAANRRDSSARSSQVLTLAGVLALAHSLATTEAAPLNFSQRAVAQDDEQTLARLFNRFERWQAIRAALQAANFGALLWAVAEAVRDDPDGLP